MNFFDFDSRLISFAKSAEDKCKNQFDDIDKNEEYNSQKVLAAFIKNKVSETHFNATTGYGYNDRGREVIDDVFADIFGCESALVRHFMLSGTHALTVALFGILRPGDTMLSVAGKPYDTLDQVIGITGENKGSLKDFGVIYKQADLKSDGTLDFDEIKKALAQKPKIVYIQRSRGYEIRPSLTIEKIEKLIKIVRDLSPSSIVFVDNCYGEFVETKEPTEVGADIMVGSLIKNPGGGMALSGGYIAGRRDLIEQCSYRLTSPGLGSEIGASLGQNSNILKGILFAPTVVANALKTAVYAACIYEMLSFDCSPKYNEYRTDIVQQIVLGSEDALITFCGGIQGASPIDSYVTPEPWDMPGYEVPVIMAAGAFVGGSSIELSADGPIKPPYAAFMQGGLIFNTSKIAIINSVQKLIDKQIITLR